MDGLTVMSGFGVGQAPAAAPVAFTVTLAEVEPSDTITVPPETAEEGLVRRIDTMLPLTVTVKLPLLEAAL